MPRKPDPDSWAPAPAEPLSPPAFRRFRVFATDPKASGDVATAAINETLVSIPWEQPWQARLTAGPCGEYVEVIDHDPASGLFYAPIDPNAPELLAQDGLAPSEGSPQFHQQMVYAVATETILSFERALGRSLYWTQETPKDDTPTAKSDGDDDDDAETDAEAKAGRGIPVTQLRLRIYPHALRENNAYYSPGRCALLFGYFRPEDVDAGDKWVFTCLSRDIIAHEVTHAILHGIDRRTIEASNLDTRAFHEGFADIVALLQHFRMRDLLENQIALSEGDLRKNSLLNGLAEQFGSAIGSQNGALRRALDILNPDHKAPQLTDSITRPHDRGGYLVAAVFDAFVLIYERRVADLMRLAFGGVMPAGRALPPDLVGRLASEAAKAADHVLRMCIRALDYVPPVDMTFGEYLRAIITADVDIVRDDRLGYRVAFAQAFRHRGIVPADSLSMSPASLVWDRPDWQDVPSQSWSGPQPGRNRLFASLLPYLQLSSDFGGSSRQRRSERPIEAHDFFEDRNLREKNLQLIERNRWETWEWLMTDSGSTEVDRLWQSLLGIELLADKPDHRDRPALKSVRWKNYPKHGGQLPVVQVESVRVVRRSGPEGEELNQLVIRVMQKRRGFMSPETQRKADAGEYHGSPDFWFRGGATLIADLRDGQLRYVIRKRIDNDERLDAQRSFLRGSGPPPADVYKPEARGSAPRNEPFAMIHRGE